MMEPIQSKSFAKPIIALKLYSEKNTLLVVDRETTIRFLDRTSWKLVDGFKAGIVHENYKGQIVDYSNDQQFLGTLSADERESRLYNAKTKKLIARVTRHHGEVSCVKFDPNNRFMLSGGDDGKVFAIDTKSGKLMFTLPSHIDTINDIAFTKNANWVATASYDRKVTLFNLVTMKMKERLRAHSAPVMHLRFFHKDKLLSIDKDAKAIVWDIKKAKVHTRLQGIHDDVRKITISTDERFLFIGTALGYVLVYDLESFELITNKFIKISSPITAMEFDGEANHLLLGTEDGFLIAYDIFVGLETIKECLRTKQLDNIQKEVEKNPLLKYTNVYDLVSNLWEKTFEKARLALEAGQKEKAKLMLAQFKHIPSLNKKIQKLFQDYEQYGKFVEFAKQGKLPMAYSLANSFPIYKESKIYQALEKQWRTTFAKAQKMMLDPKTAQRAKDVLMPYRGISEKTKYIQELLSKSSVYTRFRDAIGKKDFKMAMELVKRNPFLHELPEYLTLISFADNLYIKAHDAIAKNDFNAASKYLHILENFDDFKEEAHQLLQTVTLKQKFQLAISSNNMADAYDAMAELEELQETPEGKKLQHQWDEDVNIANTYAVGGDVLGVKKSLDKYMQITSKYTALAMMFSWTYISQLEQAVQQKMEKSLIEKGIKNYISLFGITDQIESFFETFKEHYPDTKLNLEMLHKGSLEHWRPSMIVKSILE